MNAPSCYFFLHACVNQAVSLRKKLTAQYLEELLSMEQQTRFSLALADARAQKSPLAISATFIA